MFGTGWICCIGLVWCSLVGWWSYVGGDVMVGLGLSGWVDRVGFVGFGWSGWIGLVGWVGLVGLG